MKKGLLSILFAVIVLASISVSINAATTGPVPTLNPGHNSTQIFISVGNNYITLQNAIDTGYLLRANSSPIATTALPSSSPYHFANQTLINVSSGSTNYTMTLQEAIANNIFVNGATVNYTKNISRGEYGYNINVNTTSGIQSLQSAIKNNLLSAASPCPSGYICPSGGNSGSPCYPSNTWGSLDCGGVISSGTCINFAPKAKACQASMNDWHSCDGIGHCAGYVGTYGNGCSDCPFGSSGGRCILTGSLFTTPTITWQGRSAPAPQGAPYSSWSYSTLQCQYDCNCGIYGCDTCKNFIWMKP